MTPISVSIAQAAPMIGVSESKLREMLDNKKLEITPVMAGDKQLLLFDELFEAVKKLPRKGSITAAMNQWDAALAA